MNWSWIWIAAVLAAVVIGFGVLTKRGPSSAGTQETLPQPAYYLKDAVITETTPEGAPKIRLIANRIEQQPDDDAIELANVRVDYLKVPDKQWFLSAQRGIVPADSHIIQFIGNVELKPANGPATTFLRTQELSIDSDRNLAYTTTSPVAIRFGSYAMEVKRFEADLNTERVRMEAVNGRTDKG